MAASVNRRKFKILSIDPYLKPYAGDIELRMRRHLDLRRALIGDEGELYSFANGYIYYGIARTTEGWLYREWAPGADAMHFIGDFNGWNRTSHPMTPLENGNWEIHLDGADALQHNQRVKVQVTKNGKTFDRVPLYIHAVEQDPETKEFSGRIWAPERPFRWTDGGYGRRKPNPVYIYEAHVGMAQEDEGIGSYREFADVTLKRILDAGYNTIQLMAIMQHPYYASFGYQVSNFFCPSAWFGDPDDLKYLINKAHEMGLFVLLDVVHSHAASNAADGINLFDGTPDQFFIQKDHPAWGTKLFNYAKHEVLHFLLSNLKFWQEEYHFDGFRFDGVTSMLYHNHGLGVNFVDYASYFSENTNLDAVTYLQLANELVHSVNPFAITVAEDMSGMPGMCVPIRRGGIGFDYRLAMGVPDLWVKYVSKFRDEDWDMGKLWYELTTRRPEEKDIGYAESHDQALVGDKTLIFRMADQEMYRGMEKDYHSVAIDRAIALHKIIRFLTLVLASDGYLNFMGNEFGHPEWIDFPREGNNWSYHYARRQWSLADNDQLKYQWLRDFDRAMLRFSRRYRVLSKPAAQNLWIDEEKKLIAFSRGDMAYLVNLHPTDSYPDFYLPVHTLGAGSYRAVFSTDDAQFGGQGRIDESYQYFTQNAPGKGVGFAVYSPCRTMMVFKKQD
ncbi:MAG: alpha amylase C-terminal domain-containing protein [Christensenellales bacterium]